MARTSLPPGFRFHPTDVELVKYYLKRKVLGKKLCFDAIAEVNIYKYSPWDLPDKSFLRSGDLEWYFFSPQQRKYASGGRTNRATETGYWKATGKDRVVLYNEKTAGMVKTLIFHVGHPPKGERTDWVMHEYRMTDKELSDAGVAQDSYVICKIFQKSGPGPKNGAQYGAPFCEKDWDEDDDEDADSLPPAATPLSTNDSVITSLPGGSTSSGPSRTPAAPEAPCLWGEVLPLAIDYGGPSHSPPAPEAPSLLGEVLPPALDNEVSTHLLEMVTEHNNSVLNSALPTDGSFVSSNFSGSTYAGGPLAVQDPLVAQLPTEERRPISEDDLDRLLGMFTEDTVLPLQNSFAMPFNAGFLDSAGPSRVLPSADAVLPDKPDDDDEINYLLGMFKDDDYSIDHMFGNSFF